MPASMIPELAKARSGGHGRYIAVELNR